MTTSTARLLAALFAAAPAWAHLALPVRGDGPFHVKRDGGDFGLTCDPPVLNNNYELGAWCQTGLGDKSESTYTVLDLNRCIRFNKDDGGRLEWADDGDFWTDPDFDSSGRWCGLQGDNEHIKFYCSASTNADKANSEGGRALTIPLNAMIANIKGKLKCYEHEGVTPTPPDVDKLDGTVTHATLVPPPGPVLPPSGPALPTPTAGAIASDGRIRTHLVL